MRGNKFTVKISSSQSSLKGCPFTFAFVFITLRKRAGSWRKSSIFRYSCSTANISKQGKTKRQVSLKVNTLRICSRSKINSSLSFSVEYVDLPSSSASDSLRRAVKRDQRGVRPFRSDVSESVSDNESDSLKLLFVTGFSFSAESYICFLMKSSIDSSSSRSGSCLSTLLFTVTLTSGCWSLVSSSCFDPAVEGNSAV